MSSLGQGHESHGIHTCHKCGWPFPKPHPSAKHRRAHKKVCGTIEGYKLIDSQDLNISDEENPSYEDRTTPSIKLEEKSNMEDHNSGTREISNRSEEEVFSDAVTEFPDGGSSPGVQQHLEDARVAGLHVERDLTVFYSFNDNAIADIAEPPSSRDSIQMQNPEVHVSNSTEDLLVISTGDKNQLPSDLPPVKPEIETDASQEIVMINTGDDVTEGSMTYVGPEADVINTGDDVTEGSMTYVGPEADVKGTGEINLDRNVVLLSPGEHTKTFESECKTKEKEEITSDSMPSNGVVPLKEEHGGEMASNMSLSDPTTRVESFEDMNATDGARVKVGAEQGLDLAGSVNSCEGWSGGEGKENVHELSLPSDIPVVDHAEMMLQDFKDYTGVEFLPPVTSDSSGIIKDKKDDVEDPLCVDNYTSFHSIRLSEVTKVSASEMNVLEDDLLHEGSKSLVKRLSSEGKSDDHKILNKVNPTMASVDADAKDMHDSGHHEKAIAEMCNVTGKGENESLTEESYAKNIVKTLESANLPEFPVNGATYLAESDNAGDHEKTKVEKCDVVGVESRGESLEEKLSLQTETTFESDSSLHESHVAADNVMNVSETKFTEIKFTNLDRVDIFNGNVKTQEDSEHGRNVEILDKNMEEHAMKDPIISPLDTESSIKSSVAVDGNHARELGGEGSGINQSLQVESDDDHIVKHQLVASAIDVLVDSLSQTDSLEGNWGSVSVLSTQSDMPTVVDAGTLPSTDYLASTEAEKTNLKQSEGVTERQHSEKSDIFEAPSFMTLVEPGGVGHTKATSSTIQMLQNTQQQKVLSAQAGWFPSLTNVVNESQGRKKNEEIIAKVTNWSTGKQHIPLKNLLGEANHELKPKSPKLRENKTPVIQKEETTARDNGALATTVSSILSSGVSGTETAKGETGRERNSPARYPADIKREKRKVKGRPYWVQFVCCSSVN